jgi:hypothetical protein
MSLLNIIETAVEFANPEVFLLYIISSFQIISSGIVHKRLCNLLLKVNFTSSKSKERYFESVQEIVLQSTNRRLVLSLSLPTVLRLKMTLICL